MLKDLKIKQLKERYPAGTPVKLISMEGESRMPEGLKGKVLAVDDIGQIHVNWENGSTLALNVEVDAFQRLTEQEQESSGPDQEECEMTGMDMNQQM